MTGNEPETVKFKASFGSSMRVLYKDDDRLIVWGPASVEVVDKENDRITAEALKDALPQLLRRKRLSLEHSDQLVGDILEGFEADEPKTVKIGGEEYERQEFPTDVLDPEEDNVSEKGLYVCGDIWNDTKRSRDTREDILDGKLDSYSISGEAIDSSAQVKDGDLVDNINEMDLSAVTLCEEGMNPEAKFAVISKDDDRGISPEELASIAEETVSKTMTEKEEEEEEESEDSNASEAAVDKEDLREEFKAAANEAIKDADFVTREDVKSIVQEEMGGEDDVDKEVREAAQQIADKRDESVEDVIERITSSDDDDSSDEDDEEEDGSGSASEVFEEDGDDDDEPDLPEDDGDDDEPEMPEEDEEPDLPEGGDEEPGGDDEEPDLPEEEDDPVESAHKVDLDALKSSLPDDLFAAVKEHMTDPGDGDIEMEDDEDDDSESESESDSDSEDDDDTKEKSMEEYAEQATSPVIQPGEMDLEKSTDQDPDNEEDPDQVGTVEKTGTSAMERFYESMGENPVSQ